MSEAKRESAPAVARALEILEFLAATGGSVRMSDLAGQLGMPKSSTHHVLSALLDAGWLEREPTTKEITLGLRAWEVGQAYDAAQTLSQRAQPFIDAVRDELGETVRLAILSEHDNVCIAKSTGLHTLVFDQRVGARLPAHATGLGKALLAGLSPAQIGERYQDYAFEPFTENTLVSVEALENDLAQIRERGWADDNGEFILGIQCIALPVRSRTGDVLAAISVSVPSARFDQEHQEKTTVLLTQAAAALSERLSSGVARS
ncbi:IclR family transcriptional regulator [Microbacterium sp. NPDC076911]|uniref:IclR family transcriptional regulator n=1 Tax=Microbacterium sp. NPDC076911 TaxID=3154958 RepID=UPI0034461CA6